MNLQLDDFIKTKARIALSHERLHIKWGGGVGRRIGEEECRSKDV